MPLQMPQSIQTLEEVTFCFSVWPTLLYEVYVKYFIKTSKSISSFCKILYQPKWRFFFVTSHSSKGYQIHFFSRGFIFFSLRAFHAGFLPANNVLWLPAFANLILMVSKEVKNGWYSFIFLSQEQSTPRRSAGPLLDIFFFQLLLALEAKKF